jgi:hypothetical protein
MSGTVQRAVMDLYVNCSYPTVPDPIAASDTCQKPAVSAVVDPDNGNMYYRCPEHRRQLRDGVHGRVRYLVPVTS